eukprot:Hpha_TRINITY_DN32426_c0_g1::TRINITY_DN32426_c0_g1_i1::g.30885::m.30885
MSVVLAALLLTSGLPRPSCESSYQDVQFELFSDTECKRLTYNASGCATGICSMWRMEVTNGDNKVTLLEQWGSALCDPYSGRLLLYFGFNTVRDCMKATPRVLSPQDWEAVPAGATVDLTRKHECVQYPLWVSAGSGAADPRSVRLLRGCTYDPVTYAPTPEPTGHTPEPTPGDTPEPTPAPTPSPSTLLHDSL